MFIYIKVFMVKVNIDGGVSLYKVVRSGHLACPDASFNFSLAKIDQ